MKLQGIILTIAMTAALANPAEARHRHVREVIANPGCNVLWPCEGVFKSPRGERIVKAMGGFGSAQLHYVPVQIKRASGHADVIGGRPAGCPHAFCGCGASLYLFGKIVPALNRAAEWLKFPRAEPAPRMAAVRSHHVMVLLRPTSRPGIWLVHDSNSGHHLTRVHERDITRYRIVNPQA